MELYDILKNKFWNCVDHIMLGSLRRVYSISFDCKCMCNDVDFEKKWRLYNDQEVYKCPKCGTIIRCGFTLYNRKRAKKIKDNDIYEDMEYDRNG